MSRAGMTRRIGRRALLRGAATAGAALAAAAVAGSAARARITLNAIGETMDVQSAAFENNGTIPRRFTCEGDDLSPPLSWSGPPEGTRSLALVCWDPDAPGGTFHHWALFDLPPDLRELPEGFSAKDAGGAREAVTDFGKPGYGGPCPPKGHGPHHYHFELFALDAAKLDVPGAATVADVREAAAAHALARGELVGLYERK